MTPEPSDAAPVSPTPAPAPAPRRVRSSSGPDFWQFLLVFAVGSVIAVTSFGAGILAERDWAVGRAGFGGDDPIGQVEEVAGLLEAEYYYRPEDEAGRAAFRRQLAHDAIAGMTGGLEDDFTTFLVPDLAAPVAAELSGEFEGIGVYILNVGGRLVVTSAMPGSPAERAGLLPGDVLEAADGTPLFGLPEDQSLALVRGPAGTTVRLTVRREGAGAPMEVEVERAKLEQPAVEYALVGEPGIAHLRVSIFGDKTTAQLDEALGRARADGAVGLVLDLRDNGGGWVTAAQEMVGRFVPPERGPALYEDEDPHDPDLLAEPILGGGAQVYDLPLVVLVDGGTASAAEIVVGALRDYGRATVVGSQTFGKGSVQRVHDFEDGSSARITFAQWLTPAEQVIEDQGIAPDVRVESADPQAEGDPALDRAVRALRSRGWADAPGQRW